MHLVICRVIHLVICLVICLVIHPVINPVIYTVIHPVIWCIPIWLTTSLSYPMAIFSANEIRTFLFWAQCAYMENGDIFRIILPCSFNSSSRKPLSRYDISSFLWVCSWFFWIYWSSSMWKIRIFGGFLNEQMYAIDSKALITWSFIVPKILALLFLIISLLVNCHLRNVRLDLNCWS